MIGTTDIEQVFCLPVNQPCNSDVLTYAYLVYFMMGMLEEHNYFDNKVTQNDAITLLLR